jgi:enoyl-CoA hydratase/carnithine racemase
MTILYEVKDRVAYITLNRPEKKNAINPQMRYELTQALNDVNENQEVWVAILRANGDAFSSGHDLVEHGAPEPKGAMRTMDMYIYLQRIWKPTIAAVNGLCLAQGAGLALSCDIRIASQRAKFGWPQSKRGLGSISAPSILSTIVPSNIALEYMYTGELFDAEQALRLHLVNRVVQHEVLWEEAEQFARRILQNAPIPMRNMKEITARAKGMSLEDRVHMADLHFTRIGMSEDAKEGLAAFREKREPVWKGR